MSPRGRAAAAVLLCVGTVGAVQALSVHGAQAPADGVGRQELVFSHTDHVPPEWRGAGPESARDCRGCHQFTETRDGVEQHADLSGLCGSCHRRGLLEISSETRGLGTLQHLREMPGSFLHVDHGGMECRDCHEPTRGRNVPARFEVPRGTEFCQQCHGQADLRDPARAELLAGFAEVDYVDGFLSRLNESPAVQAEAFGPFLHRDHLEDPALVDADENATCLECHGALATGSSEGQPPFAAAKFDVESCSQCHISESGPLDFILDRPAQPSRSAGAFYHDDHIGLGAHDPELCSGEGHAAIQGQSCAACHAYDPDESASASAFGFLTREGSAEDVSRYAGCVACHDDWNAPHDAWSERGCTECHQFPGNLKSDRAVEVVNRTSEVRFSFTRNAHKFITVSADLAGDDPEEAAVREASCVPCHRAAVQDLPSRITAEWSRFDHDVHLGPSPTSDDCRRCHTDEHVGGTISSVELGLPDGGVRRSYSLDACSECHLASPGLQAAGTERAVHEVAARSDRAVVRFPHGAHVGEEWNGAPMACSTCHEAPEGGAPFARVGVKEDALSCVACHDHTANAGITPHEPALPSGDVESCVRCHFDRTKPEPIATAPRFESEGRTEFVGLVLGGAAQPTHHAAGQACSDCHLPVAGAIKPTVFEVAASASRKNDQTLHELDGEDEGRPKNCLACHWSQLADRGKYNKNALRRQDFAGPANAEKALKNYPGGDADG